jgi:hypothetical protein
MTPRVFLGIDLSLTGCGLVAVPESWGLDWGRVAHLTVGETMTENASAEARIKRLSKLAAVVVKFASKHRVTDAWVEGYPNGSWKAPNSISLLAELGGVIKVRLLEEIGLPTTSAPIASARKLILGKVPRGEAKEAVAQVLWKSGARFSTVDESDAFAAANFGLYQSSLRCVYQSAK